MVSMPSLVATKFCVNSTKYKKRSSDQMVAGSTPAGCTITFILYYQWFCGFGMGIKTPKTRLFT